MKNIVPNARLVMSGLTLSGAVAMQFMTTFGVRMISMFLLGYLFHGLLHSVEMMLDHEDRIRRWDKIKEHGERVEKLERQLMASSRLGEPS